MSERIPRRAVLGAALVGGVGALAASDVRTLLDQFAPLSGDAWDAVDRTISDRVESPYGEATIHRDEHGVPHVEADDQRAAYFATGYVQGFDRLAQMDLQRRQMRGELSEVAGEMMVESDEFHVAMDFVGAAEATWEVVAEDDRSILGEAYADGVNAAMEREQLPLEFELLGYEPDPWTPVDSMLMEKLISWQLTGSFRELRKALVDDRLGADAANELYPDRLDHDVPIIREDGAHGDVGGVEGEYGGGNASGVDASRGDVGGGDASGGDAGGVDASRGDVGGGDASGGDDGSGGGSGTAGAGSVGAAVTSFLSGFESPPGIGSNSWIVSGDHTESGQPILANDPHLTLMTPPVWYEQHVETPDRNVRGVTFPGVPFVIIGANDHGAWGFTNVGADVLDCYRYELSDDGERYRYDGEWHEFDIEEREIVVDGAENVTKTVRKTDHEGEHGHVNVPVIEREGETVGVAWTGLSATRTTEAMLEFGDSEGLEDVLEATELFDLPTQNLVYADADGRTLYYATGKLPIRTIDGEVVDGNRIFDGSAGEAEWEGFTAYGESSWEGFVPFEEKPHAIDPGALATSNQRVVDDPTHYIGAGFADPYRGQRIYDRLDDVVESDEATDPAFHRELQTDVGDERAPQLVPELLEAIETVGETADDPGALEDAASDLEDWDHRMTRDSAAALTFARWMDHFTEAVVGPAFDDADLDPSYYPNDWVIATLPEDSQFFEEASRAETMVAALEAALGEIDEEGWETYGDWNHTGPVAHPFGEQAPFLNYDQRPTDGSRATVNNYRVETDIADGPVGASLRMVAEPGGDTDGILPGGNSGDYFSEHYDDQFDDWRNGEYRSMNRTVEGDRLVTFEEGEQ